MILKQGIGVFRWW